MDLHVLPERASDAAGNMAVDFLLLQRYPEADVVRFRHYAWQRPAFTFGYSQKIADVRARLPAEERLDLTRRATGGGLVDHRHDWTYALVLPRKHALFDRPGPTIYQCLHEAMARALQAQGGPVELQRENPETEPGVCFARPEVHDVIRSDTTEVKVAGAALKRGKHAILLQGSVWRPAVPELADWDAFAETFVAELASALAVNARPTGFPEFSPEEEEALVNQYASPEWIERR